MKKLRLDYELPGVDYLFSVPSADPLQNSGPLRPLFEQLLADLRCQRVPKSLHVSFSIPAVDYQPGVVAALRAAWPRVLDSRIQAEQQRFAELRITRRTFLLKGLLVLFFCLVGVSLLGEPDRPSLKTLAESLIIGGWVSVWVPLERILYSGWPIGKEIAILKCLAGCELEFKPKG